MNKQDESIKELTNKIVEIIDEYRSQRYIELEFRLGHIFPDHFSAEINDKHYNKIKEQLDTMNSEVPHQTVKYTCEYDNDGRRKIGDKIIKKTRLRNIDFSIKDSPFDVRFSVSKEQPVKIFNSDKITRTSEKERTSYVHRGIWTYDLTVSDGSSKSVEIEIDTKAARDKTKYVVYNTLMKINDLSRIAEGTEPGPYEIVN
jgi:hypothetical protein